MNFSRPQYRSPLRVSTAIAGVVGLGAGCLAGCSAPGSQGPGSQAPAPSSPIAAATGSATTSAAPFALAPSNDALAGFSSTSADATPYSEPVTGFVDLHNHQFAEYAYQGAWYHGTTLGPEQGDDTWAGMRACDGNKRSGPQDHAMTFMNVLCGVAGWETDDMCLHTDRTQGYTSGPGSEANYSGWPHSTSWAHQQTWWGHLKAAHEDGLNITVVHMVNFKTLCQVMEPDNYKYFYDCEDLGAVDLEIAAAKEFAALNADWAEIAYTPEDARRIIHQGKLAMVLAIEVTGLFPTGNMDYAPMIYDTQGKIVDRGGVFTQLHHYYDLGIRSIQLGHELDSRFAGVATYSSIFTLLQAIVDFQDKHPHLLQNIQVPGGHDPNHGFKLDASGYNELGLTDEGKELVPEMMKLGMLVDLAHLSYNTDRDVYAIAKANNYYPMLHSHSKFAEIMVLPGEEALEKYTPDWVANMINATGGMVGMRTFSARVNSYPETGVANNCDGSSRSFLQAYAYADKELNIPLAFGVDFNGFTNQTDPRFGETACNKAVDEATQLSQQEQQTDGGTGTDYDFYGLGHMGLLGRGLVQDMRNLGADTTNLERSAEHYIQMWERSVDPGRVGPLGPPPVTLDSDLQKHAVGGELTLTSIISGPDAVAGSYSIKVSGSSAAKTAQLILNGTTPLETVSYNESERVTPQGWRTFTFGTHLTVKVGATSQAGSDLTQLDDTLFNTGRSIKLDWP